MSIDETTDSNRIYVVNIIIDTQVIDCSGNIILLTFDRLKKVNHSIIVKLCDKSMVLLWPSGVQLDDILLFISDTAPHINSQ